MKFVWLLLAILLTCLAVGGFSTVARRGDPIDLILSVVLAAGAIGCWRRVSAARGPRPGSANGPERPWKR